MKTTFKEQVQSTKYKVFVSSSEVVFNCKTKGKAYIEDDTLKLRRLSTMYSVLYTFFV